MPDTIMPGSPHAIALKADPRFLQILSDGLKINGIDILCDMIPEHIQGRIEFLHDENVQSIQYLPVRFGDVLDEIRKLVKYDGTPGHNQVLDFNGYTLDVLQALFFRQGYKNPVRLTEKEIEILKLLHAYKGCVVPRAQLLDMVWGYVADLETHTLETHIYRLRQKIEDNPSHPMILLTEGNGYKIP